MILLKFYCENRNKECPKISLQFIGIVVNEMLITLDIYHCKSHIRENFRLQVIPENSGSQSDWRILKLLISQERKEV